MKALNLKVNLSFLHKKIAIRKNFDNNFKSKRGQYNFKNYKRCIYVYHKLQSEISKIFPKLTNKSFEQNFQL